MFTVMHYGSLWGKGIIGIIHPKITINYPTIYSPSSQVYSLCLFSFSQTQSELAIAY